MADIGYISLLLALVLSLYSIFASLIGLRKSYPELLKSGKNAVLAAFGLVMLAAFALMYSFIKGDYSLEYVASYSSNDMSLLYKVAAFWAGNQGSLLIWTIVLALSSTILVTSRVKAGSLQIWAVAIVMMVETFFLFNMTFVTNANPFARVPFPPPDGRGLNPLLENMGMFFHPLTLLSGYAFFTVPFAFALAAMITGKLGVEWIVMTRRWTLTAWLLLGLGNLFGMQWSYVELGWGGMWAWDPVENASFMPWLTATAFLHSVMIQRRRGMLKIWNMLLIILTFSLSILGTLITRSGILASIHSFGQSALGPIFMSFLAIGLIGSLWLLFTRMKELKSDDELDSVISRESSFLYNNLIFVAITFATLLGTLFPIISEAVRGVKITVGPPFYNQVNGPIFILLILLMGVCPLLGWKRATPFNLLRNFLYPFVMAVVLAILLRLGGIKEWYVILGFCAAGFVVFTIFLEWYRGVRARRKSQKESFLVAFYRLILANKPRYGGYIVHLSIIMIAIGTIGSMAFKAEKEVSIKAGDSVSVRDYTLKFEGLSEYHATRKKTVWTAAFSVYNSGDYKGALSSEKFNHVNYENPVTDVGIRSTLKEDLYVILMGWDQDGTTAIKVLVNPMIIWVWIGGFFFIAGGLITLWPDRKQETNA